MLVLSLVRWHNSLRQHHNIGATFFSFSFWKWDSTKIQKKNEPSKKDKQYSVYFFVCAFIWFFFICCCFVSCFVWICFFFCSVIFASQNRRPISIDMNKIFELKNYKWNFLQKTQINVCWICDNYPKKRNPFTLTFIAIEKLD